MKRFLLTFCCMCMLLGLQAQQRTVTGRVTDETDGSTLPGVSIVVKGTSRGTVTDNSGAYSLPVSNTDILVFTFIGFEQQEITVGERTNIDVVMRTSVNELQEVVVIGYGERERKDLTGSISTVKSEDIASVPFASPQFALQGKSTGVRVINTSGNPSDPPTIFIRGIGTWNGTAQPLYVIDGQIISPPQAGNQDLIGNINLWASINPNDIESISVLKDASATAIYGSRAANGVILITTKRGKKGKPVIEINSQYGIQNIPTSDVLSTPEMVRLSREIYTNSVDPNVSLERNFYGRDEANDLARSNNFTPQLDPQSPYYIGEPTMFVDWQDAIRKNNAVNQSHSIQVSGAGESANYFVSVGYTEQQSVVIGNDLERYTLALNVNTDVNKFIKAGVNYKLSYQESGNNSPMRMIEAASAPPYQPIFDPSNPFGYAPTSTLYDETGQWAQRRNYGSQSRINALALANINYGGFDILRNMGQGYIEITPIEGLRVRGGLSMDYVYQQRRTFQDIADRQFRPNPSDPYAGDTPYPTNSFGDYQLRTNKFFNYQMDLTATYDKQFDKHRVTLMLGGQDQFRKQWNEDLGTREVTSRDPARWSVPNGQPQNRTGFAGRSEYFWYSYFGRFDYVFDSKYYLNLSGRRDASNGFPKENRWGFFPSVSAGWRISSESFMDGIPFLNDLKLRGSWGQVGNDETVVGRFAYLSKVNSGSGSYSTGSGDGDARGNYNTAVVVSDLPNPDLRWEVVTSTNVGFDALLFNNRVNFTAEYFNRVTDDILQAVNIPLSVGASNPVQNIGSARNRGVEFDLGYNGKIGPVTYNVSGNISFLTNTVLNLYDGQPLTTDRGRVEEGRSIGHIWGYKLGGIFQSQAEIDAYYASTPDETIGGNAAYVRPGDMYFLDVQGNPTDEERFYSRTPDGRINSFDQTEIGNSIPGHTYGVNISASFKGLDLSVNFYGEGDVDRVSTIRQRLEAMNAGGLNYSATTLGRWTPENPSTTMPRAVFNDPAGNNRFSSRWVEKAGFFRLNTWQLGYSIPANILEKTKGTVSRFRVYVGGQNNMLITRWSGLDPVNDDYPLPRSWFVGLNASL